MNRVAFVCLPCLLVAALGCSNNVGPVAEVVEVVDASGTLTYQGKPLEGFIVTFMPVDGDRPATGMTDASGKFVLGTNDAGDGAVAGANKVAVVWAGPQLTDDTTAGAIDDPSLMPKAPVNIPAKYSNPETSQITIDVPSSGGTDLNVELK